MTLPHAQKLEYFLWAANRARTTRDAACPACRGFDTHVLKRKYIVTALRECCSCGLRFRTPKDNQDTLEKFYQTSYSQGFTTDCPSDDVLAALCSKRFAGSARDFGEYIKVLNAVGLRSGDTILDFGSSWGYGSWQFRNAGFEVVSYEISKPRAEYSRKKLGCTTIDSVGELHGRVRCMFSSHVIEHLPNPNIIWQIANQVLTKNGVIICICPNGGPDRESYVGSKHYHQAWGKVHPLLINPRFLRNISGSHGFSTKVYSSPYQMDIIREGAIESPIRGDELCMVGRCSE